jgi:outer membrane protein assembly factor BamB
MLAAINKDGSLYLYNRAAISSGPVQSIQMSISTDNADFVGMPAYDPVTNYLYVEQPATFGIYKPGVAAFSISSSCTLNPTPVWAAVFGADGALTDDDSLRSPISVANGVLYISDYGTSTTYAFDALSGAQLWSLTLPGPGAVGPIAVDGRLYIGSMGSKMTAFVP